MSTFEMKLPDVGEGVAEAEIVSWMVEVGDEVTSDSVLAEVLTDKATVEVSSPVAGTVTELHGEPGDLLAVGSNLVGIEVADDATPTDPDEPGASDAVDGHEVSGREGDDGSGSAESGPEALTDDATSAGANATAESGAASDVAAAEGPGGDDTTASASAAASGSVSGDTAAEDSGGDDTSAGALAASGDTASDRSSADDESNRPATRALAAPAVRRRAADLGIDLEAVDGSGPQGRVVHGDLDRMLADGSRSSGRQGSDSGGQRVEPVRGLRRRIAGRLTTAWTEIPHITYVDAVDVTELERLRAELNRGDEGVRLTVLPFIVRAIAIACGEQPRINAHYDHAAETLTVHDAVHAGIATQTDSGLMVPVLRDAGTLRLSDLAGEIGRVTEAARGGTATREELSGSTITITSLGALGGLVTTPILNPPEVAIVGVNKIEVRPVWRDGAFQPRQMLNLSSSFDHRMVDGWDAAIFVQRIKSLLEIPALLFTDD